MYVCTYVSFMKNEKKQRGEGRKSKNDCDLLLNFIRKRIKSNIVSTLALIVAEIILIPLKMGRKWSIACN